MCFTRATNCTFDFDFIYTQDLKRVDILGSVHSCYTSTDLTFQYFKPWI